MTAFERSLLAGVRLLTNQRSGRSEFTIDNKPTVFRGVPGQFQFDTDPASGGRSVDATLTIVAETAQFETAGVNLRSGMRITYQGQNWVINSFPDRDNTEGFITIQCSNEGGRR